MSSPPAQCSAVTDTLLNAANLFISAILSASLHVFVGPFLHVLGNSPCFLLGLSIVVLTFLASSFISLNEVIVVISSVRPTPEVFAVVPVTLTRLRFHARLVVFY